MLEELTPGIEKLIMPCIDDAGAEFVEWHLKRRGKTAVVEVVADKDCGRITIEECACINRAIVQALEAAQLLGDDYAVEVSSPGLDRPLKTFKDFLRVRGCEVHFYLRERIQGRLEYIGIIREVKEDKIIVGVQETLVELPLDRIQKAVQFVEM